jgi:hypothetical protein
MAQTFLTLWQWLTSYAGAILTLIIIFSFIGVLWRYISARTDLVKFQKFEIYNDLIRQFIETGATQEPVQLQRQTARSAQFRNFPEQFDATARLLENLLESWKSGGQDNPVLFKEMELAIEFMKKAHFRQELGKNIRNGVIAFLIILVLGSRFGLF